MIVFLILSTMMTSKTASCDSRLTICVIAQSLILGFSCVLLPPPLHRVSFLPVCVCVGGSDNFHFRSCRWVRTPVLFSLVFLLSLVLNILLTLIFSVQLQAVPSSLVPHPSDLYHLLQILRPDFVGFTWWPLAHSSSPYNHLLQGNSPLKLKWV